MPHEFGAIGLWKTFVFILESKIDLNDEYYRHIHAKTLRC